MPYIVDLSYFTRLGHTARDLMRVQYRKDFHMEPNYLVLLGIVIVIIGNAFAAITVMTVGIGAPFVLAYGADPAAIGILALTCGYCGTLCTPMAANFNIVPVAMLDMKDRMGVIKKQVLPAMVMIVVQIVYMLIAQ